jgi:hypothetical protein
LNRVMDLRVVASAPAAIGNQGEAVGGGYNEPVGSSGPKFGAYLEGMGFGQDPVAGTSKPFP